MPEFFEILITFLVVVHSTEVFRKETSNTWPRDAAWEDPAIRAKLKLLLALMSLFIIKSAPVIYYTVKLYEDIRV